jgi:hypothetical protein
MKIATAEVVLPNMCSGVEMAKGSSIPARDSRIPERIDRISGFFESLFKTRFNPSHTVDFSRLYSSRTVMDNVTLTGEIEAAANVDRCSPVSPKANVMKGMPKKARLPKMVLRISR